MRPRPVRSLAVLAALPMLASALLWAGPAGAQTTQLLAGKRLTLKQGGRAERLSIVSLDALVAPLPGGTDDPTRMGAVLDIGNPATGEWTRFLAPAAGWSLNPLGTVFRFQAGRTPRAAGSVRRLVIRHGKRLKVRGTAVGLSLDEPAQGTLAVVLTTGSRRYCLLFGGAVRRDQPRRFSARNSPAPASCPEPSAPQSTTTTSTTSTTVRTTPTTAPLPASTSTSSSTSSTSGPGPTVASTSSSSTSSSSSSSSTGAPAPTTSTSTSVSTTTSTSTSVSTTMSPAPTTSSTSSSTSSSSTSTTSSSSSSTTRTPTTSTTSTTGARFTCGGFGLFCGGTCPPGLQCRGGLVVPCTCEAPGR